MENEYNVLEERLMEGELSEVQKIRILERQKELLLSFLVDANKNIFTSLRNEEEDIWIPEINNSNFRHKKL
jgi:hypothetical protein